MHKPSHNTSSSAEGAPPLIGYYYPSSSSRSSAAQGSSYGSRKDLINIKDVEDQESPSPPAPQCPMPTSNASPRNRLLLSFFLINARCPPQTHRLGPPCASPPSSWARGDARSQCANPRRGGGSCTSVANSAASASVLALHENEEERKEERKGDINLY